MIIGACIGLAVTSALSWLRYSHCRACVPHCPNGHHIVIAGHQGILFASTVCLLMAIAEHFLM